MRIALVGRTCRSIVDFPRLMRVHTFDYFSIPFRRRTYLLHTVVARHDKLNASDTLKWKNRANQVPMRFRSQGCRHGFCKWPAGAQVVRTFNHFPFARPLKQNPIEDMTLILALQMFSRYRIIYVVIRFVIKRFCEQFKLQT